MTPADTAAFQPGDRVAWSHGYAAQFPAGVVVYATAVPQGDPGQPGTGQFGTVVGPGNEQGTWWDVQVDGEKSVRTLTMDELVKVKEEPS